MVMMQELLKNYNLNDQSEDIQNNLKILLERVNKIRAAYGKPMKVTSGLRTMEDHLRIYREKAAAAGVPFNEAKVPKQSKHLYGQAVDIADADHDLQDWCKANEALLVSTGLWMEDFSVTTSWVHFQVVPPKSGKRWFMP